MSTLFGIFIVIEIAAKIRQASDKKSALCNKKTKMQAAH